MQQINNIINQNFELYVASILVSPSNWCKSSEISWRSLYCWKRIKTHNSTPPLCLDCKLLSKPEFVSILITIDNTRAKKQHLTAKCATTNLISKNKSRKSTQEIQLHGRDWVFSPALGLSRLNMLIEVFVTFCRSEVLSSQCSLYIQNTNNKDQIQTYHCCTKPALPKQPRKTPYRNVKLQPPWSSEIW